MEWKPPARRGRNGDIKIDMSHRKGERKKEAGRGSRSGPSKKAESAGTEKDRKTGGGTARRDERERQKGEGAECMEIRSHAIQL